MIVQPLMLRGEEWRHRSDPKCQLKDAGPWVRRVQHSNGSVQHYGARSPHPSTRDEAERMIEYIDNLVGLIGAKSVAKGFEAVETER